MPKIQKNYSNDSLGNVGSGQGEKEEKESSKLSSLKMLANKRGMPRFLLRQMKENESFG
jgi:hypothetical protein